MKKKILAVALILMLCPCFATATELPHSMGLTGVGNARELGGYPAGDGRVIKHGVFLRTASLQAQQIRTRNGLKMITNCL